MTFACRILLENRSEKLHIHNYNVTAPFVRGTNCSQSLLDLTAAVETAF